MGGRKYGRIKSKIIQNLRILKIEKYNKSSEKIKKITRNAWIALLVSALLVGIPKIVIGSLIPGLNVLAWISGSFSLLNIIRAICKRSGREIQDNQLSEVIQKINDGSLLEEKNVYNNEKGMIK